MKNVILQPVKKLLASLFLFIFSFQVLPVKEIGKILFKGGMTEEIHEAHCDIDDEGNFELNKQQDPYNSNYHSEYYNKLAVLTSNGLSTSTPQHISKQFIPDIVTPPPNWG